MKRQWKMLAIVASVAVASLAVVAMAAAAQQETRSPDTRGACLADNPEALKDMEALHAEKQTAWQAWSETYAADRQSDEAQAALQQLREDHWSAMRALLEEYDIEVPEGAGPGSRASTGGGEGGGMMKGAGNGGMLNGAGNGGDCIL